MFVACGMWCLADVSSVSPSSEQTGKMNDRLHYSRPEGRGVRGVCTHPPRAKKVRLTGS